MTDHEDQTHKLLMQAGVTHCSLLQDAVENMVHERFPDVRINPTLYFFQKEGEFEMRLRLKAPPRPDAQEPPHA